MRLRALCTLTVAWRAMVPRPVAAHTCSRQRLGANFLMVALNMLCAQDILEAAPVDKFFELYKPGGGSAGGFIRVAISFLEPDQVRGLANPGIEANRGQKKSSGAGLLVGLGVMVAGAVLFAFLKGHKAKKETKRNE